MQREKALSLCTFLILSSLLRAEATKEIYKDSGLYQNTNLLLFSDLATAPSLEFTGVGSIPEGLKTLKQTVSPGQTVSWGLANVSGPGSFNIVTRNFSDYLGGHVRFWLNSTASMFVRVQYDGIAPDPAVNIPSTNGQWVEAVIPLTALGATPNRLQHVNFPFMFVSTTQSTQQTFYIDHIRWTKPLANLVVKPNQVVMGNGQSSQFTVEGRDAAGEHVVVYPSFSSSIGTLNTITQARSAVLRLTQPSGSGTLTVTSDGLSSSAAISATANRVQERFGILSETYSGLVLGNTNSNLFLFSEATANPQTLPVIQEIIEVSPEGIAHHRITFQQKSQPTQFQGMTFQWGEDQSPGSVLDMSNYYDGSLRFWFKGPSQSPELMSKLTVGIKSANVTAGEEISNVLLQEYVEFDNHWHEVAIPLSEIAGAAPWADLSRMKDLVVFTVVGTLSNAEESLRTIFVDNIRWDTERPVQSLQGDYNSDGVVDAADYVVWRRTFGSNLQLAADGNRDGTVNHADYDVWQSGFGGLATATGTLSAAPEPTAGLLNAIGILASLLIRRPGSKSHHRHSGAYQLFL